MVHVCFRQNTNLSMIYNNFPFYHFHRLLSRYLLQYTCTTIPFSQDLLEAPVETQRGRPCRTRTTQSLAARGCPGRDPVCILCKSSNDVNASIFQDLMEGGASSKADPVVHELLNRSPLLQIPRLYCMQI